MSRRMPVLALEGFRWRQYSSLVMLTGVGTVSSTKATQWLSDEFSREGSSIDNRLFRLRGLEKLVRARRLLMPFIDRSELSDGERGGGGGGMRGERGGVVDEKALIDDNLLGRDMSEASRRPGRSSSGLSDGTGLIVVMAWVADGVGGVKAEI